MAYVFAADYVIGDASAAASITIPIPTGHQPGDLLIVMVQQDVGSGVFTISGGGAWSNAFASAQTTLNAQRTYAWYRLAASNDEADALISSTLSRDIHAIAFVVRGANQTSPIHKSAIAAAAGQPVVVFPSVTTTLDNCLLIYGLGNDSTGARFSGDPTKSVKLARGISGGGVIVAAYQNQFIAGATTTDPGFRKAGGPTNGAGFVIAIADDGGLKRRGYLASSVTLVRHYGYTTNALDPIDAYAAPSSIAPVIDGYKCVSSAYGAPAALVDGNVGVSHLTYTSFSSGPDTTTEVTSVWCGTTQIFAAPVDLSNGIILFDHALGFLSTAYMDPKGTIIAFADSSGNWKAFGLSKYRDLTVGTTEYYRVTLDPINFPAIDGAGAMNWASVAKMGIFWLKKPSIASARSMQIRLLMVARDGDIKFIPGYGQSDISFIEDLENAVNGWQESHLVDLQGVGQGVLRTPIQIGDGSGKLSGAVFAQSLEFLRAYTPSIKRRFNKIGAGSHKIRLRATAGETISLNSSLLASEIGGLFVIDQNSSPAAKWDFAGLSIVGLAVENAVPGVVFNGVTFSRCKTIALSGGAMNSCVIDKADVSPAVITNSPQNISNCSFISAGGGHALQITTPGTYAFAGNSFKGYATSNGVSGNEAIYNMSGGVVVLNVSAGGATPSVRDGPGATTIVNSGATLTVQGIAPGSRLLIRRTDTLATLVNVSVTGTSYAYAYPYSADMPVEIILRNASGGAAWQEWRTLLTLGVANSAITASQIQD